MKSYLVLIEVNEEELKEEVGEGKFTTTEEAVINEMDFFLGWATIKRITAVDQDKVS